MENLQKSLLMLLYQKQDLKSTKKSAKACKYGKSTKKSANSTLSEITKSTKKSAKVPKYGKSTKKSAEACKLWYRECLYAGGVCHVPRLAPAGARLGQVVLF